MDALEHVALSVEHEIVGIAAHAIFLSQFAAFLAAHINDEVDEFLIHRLGKRLVAEHILVHSHAGGGPRDVAIEEDRFLCFLGKGLRLFHCADIFHDGETRRVAIDAGGFTLRQFHLCGCASGEGGGEEQGKRSFEIE